MESMIGSVFGDNLTRINLTLLPPQSMAEFVWNIFFAFIWVLVKAQFMSYRNKCPFHCHWEDALLEILTFCMMSFFHLFVIQ